VGVNEFLIPISEIWKTGQEECPMDEPELVRCTHSFFGVF